MTSKLIETFDMSPSDVGKKAVKQYKKEMTEIITNENLTEHDEFMSNMSEETTRMAKELYSIALDGEPRHAAEILNSVANLMRLAFDAENSKLEKRTKLLEVELKVRKLDHDLKNEDPNQMPSNMVSREDLMQLLQAKSEESDK